MRVDQIRRLSDSRPARLDRTRRRFGRSVVLTEKTLPFLYSLSRRNDVLHFFGPSGRNDVFHFFKQRDRVRELASRRPGHPIRVVVGQTGGGMHAAHIVTEATS